MAGNLVNCPDGGESGRLSNSLRAHLSQFGVVTPVGRMGLDRLLAIVADPEDHRIPTDARTCLQMLAAQLAVVKELILENDRRIRESARETELGRRRMEIPGIGPLLASALVASVADPATFKTSRDLAAWIGLAPKQNSSGGVECLGGISRGGNRSSFLGKQTDCIGASEAPGNREDATRC
jgi:transposase